MYELADLVNAFCAGALLLNVFDEVAERRWGAMWITLALLALCVFGILT